MRRLGLLDQALIFTLVPIWAFWFALYLNNLARGRVAVLPIHVSAPQISDNYPTVLGFWNVPWGGLQVGDRLLRIGHADLRGVWPIGFLARAYKETDASLRVPLVFLRASDHHEAVVSLSPSRFPWVYAPINLSFVGFTLLLLLRKPNSRLTRASFLMTIVLSFQLTPFAAGVQKAPLALTYVWASFVFVSSFVVLPLILRPTFLFPEQAGSLDVRLPKWPWLFSVAGPIWTGWMIGVPPAPLSYVSLIIYLAFIITYLGRGTYLFFHADPIARRQVKWVLYGVYVALVPIFAVRILAFVRPSLWPIDELVRIFYVIIPLCAFIAIVRFNLFDIDRLISATVAYCAHPKWLIGRCPSAPPRGRLWCRCCWPLWSCGGRATCIHR